MPDTRTVEEKPVEKAKDGGPAFPQSDLSQYDIGPSEHGNAGMSLRDYFAGQALAGILSHKVECTMIETAEWAYDYADAMLKAREDRP